MRICIIGPASNVHVQRWSEALARRGHSVSILSTSPLDVPLPSHLQHLAVFEIPTARAGMSADERLRRLIGGWGRVPALVAALRPDIVHLHSLPVPAATPFLLRVPRLVVSAWGSDVVWRHPRKERWYPWLLARAARVTATSQYLADVVATYLRRPRHVDVVAFGVDPDLFHPAASAPRVPRIGTLRHLEPKYGIDTLVRAMPAVAATHASVEVEIAGGGSQRAQMELLIERLHLSRQVRLWGRIDHHEAPEFLRRLDLFVNPSREEEFGVAAVEAQASGLPVIASRVGGLPEVVLDGETGVLVPPDDSAALAQVITALLDDPDRMRRYGDAARAWATTRYRWDHNVDQMLQVYEEARASV